MTWYADQIWVDSTLKFMYVLAIFPLIGLPLYLLLALVIHVHYQYMNIWSLAVVLDIFESPLETIDEEWTVSNWFLFPVRRSILFQFLTLVGLAGNLMIPINFIIVPVTGLLAWINNYY